MKPVIMQNIKECDQVQLKKSFHLLTKQLTALETNFTSHIQSQIHLEFDEHQQYVLMICKQFNEQMR